MDEPRRVKAPSVHLNGTGRAELCKQFEDAHTALESAAEALGRAAPNARDYYVQGLAAFALASAEHLQRIRTIEGVQREVVAIWEAVQDGRDSAEVANG